MGKQTSKTAIGAFVIGAIALTVMSVIVFGSGKLFSKTIPVVFYFNGSVQGLSVGSPGTFKGVQIGEVKEISLTFNPEGMELKIPVHAGLYPDRIQLTTGQRRSENLKKAIEAGLRAQLQTQSLITGQLMIALDFHPDEPARYQGDGSVIEIPTVPTVVEQLSQVIKGIKFDEILSKLTRVVEGVEKLVNAPELASSLKSLDAALQDIQKLARSVDRQVDPLSGSVISAADEYGKLAKNINKELAEMSDVLEKTLASAQATSEKMEKTLNNSANITSDGSPVMHEMLQALRDMSGAAKSMQSLADSLERHPESVIFGKKGDSR